MLWGPAIDGESEGGFGDERVAADWFERAAGGVTFRLIIAADDAHSSFVFDADLGGAEHVAGGMQRDGDGIDAVCLTPVEGVDHGGGAESTAQHAEAFPAADVAIGTEAGMVCVCVSDHGTAGAFPWVHVEITGGAVQPGGCFLDEGWVRHGTSIQAGL